VVSRGPAPVNFANKDLKWETSTQFDIGFDASLLDGKVDVTFDYYSKQSDDVLIGLPLPYVSGYFLPADANVGSIKNTGIELTASYRNSVGDFTYGISGNITTVKNEVTDLGEVSEIVTGIGGGQTHRTIVGESVGHFYGYKTNGLYQTQEEVNAAIPDAFSSGLEPGDVRFVDVNGDGTVNADDRTVLGSPIPGFFYGFQLDASYKGFDFAMFFQGLGDRQVYNQGREELEALSGNQNFSSSVLGRWTGANTSNSVPRLTESDPNGNQRYSDRWVENAGYMRIKNFQIGYTFPMSIVERLDFVSNIRAYIGVQNLATFTDYTGFDPEVGRAQSFQKGEFPLATGQDGGASPQPRVFQFGWQISF
jgi:outer membrane receptor protein involved in Fe transport